ncbi:hypothetical protein [Archangium sp. Cb G35]|uniref:hypothetical protein n=1 Tax=Archangium sp. Cb G35 TaxID=1920190 RepID=UPI0011611D2F|nr:hypothetical protein [Archangium sp. Cb G35]
MVPLPGPGTQIVRCTGCGAALQVSVRPAEPAVPPRAPAPSSGEGGARPRRRPMVEVSGPRRAEVQPRVTFTVELSQSEIDTEPLEADTARPAPAQAPAPAPAQAPVASTLPLPETPWFAEDIERLPEANVELGKLALENFEPFPSLPQRAPVSHLQGK